MGIPSELEGQTRGVILAFKNGGMKEVNRRYRKTSKGFVPRKTDIPLSPKGYEKVTDLPQDVQDLPGSGPLYWLDCYNHIVKSIYPEKAKDYAWRRIKRKYYYKKGTWRSKMEENEKTGYFKGFMKAKIRKAKRSGKSVYYIEGKASDTSIDLEDDRMSPEFIQKMQKTAVGLNIYIDHDHSLDKTAGVIIGSGGDEDNFFIKGRLEDPEKNPDVAKIVSKQETGIQIGFSIGGRILKVIKAHSEEIGRTVRAIKDGILAEVSVTTMPALATTLGAEVSLAKSLSKALDDLEDEEVFDSELLTDDEDLTKILEEVFMLDKVRDAIYSLTWSFMSLTRQIAFSTDLKPEVKKDKILQVSEEYAENIESLSAKLAELVAEQAEFLEADEAA